MVATVQAKSTDGSAQSTDGSASFNTQLPKYDAGAFQLLCLIHLPCKLMFLVPSWATVMDRNSGMFRLYAPEMDKGGWIKLACGGQYFVKDLVEEGAFNRTIFPAHPAQYVEVEPDCKVSDRVWKYALHLSWPESVLAAQIRTILAAPRVQGVG